MVCSVKSISGTGFLCSIARAATSKLFLFVLTSIFLISATTKGCEIISELDLGKGGVRHCERCLTAPETGLPQVTKTATEKVDSSKTLFSYSFHVCR